MINIKGVEKLNELISNSSTGEKELIARVIECISEVDGSDLNKNFLTNLINEYLDVSKKLEIKTNEVEELAEFDELTMVYNKKRFQEKLKYEILRKNRYNHELSMIYIDLDGFKKINDIYGYPTGDKVIQEIAVLIKNFLREIDIVSRWIGEAFIVLLPETDLGECVNIAERLRALIESHEFEHVGNITAGFGVTEYEEEDDDQTLISRAEEYLYEAKERGPNTIVHH